MTPKHTAIILTAISLVAFLPRATPAQADQCTASGSLALMLNYIDNKCVRYTLTESGKKQKIAAVLATKDVAPNGDVDIKPRLAGVTLLDVEDARAVMRPPEPDEERLGGVRNGLRMALLIGGAGDPRGIVAIRVRLLRKGKHPLADRDLVRPTLAVALKRELKSAGDDRQGFVIEVEPSHESRRAA